MFVVTWILLTALCFIRATHFVPHRFSAENSFW